MKIFFKKKALAQSSELIDKINSIDQCVQNSIE